MPKKKYGEKWLNSKQAILGERIGSGLSDLKLYFLNTDIALYLRLKYNL